jgi:hypothetical protein
MHISYSSSDRLKAQELGRRLEKEGWSVWWDRKINPGQSFSKVLEEALNSAKCVVVLWSKRSVASDWVQNEAAEGKRRGILVPAFIEDTAPPFEFRRIQATNLVDWDKETPGNELPQFLEAVRNVLSGEDSHYKQATFRDTAEYGRSSKPTDYRKGTRLTSSSFINPFLFALLITFIIYSIYLIWGK